MISLDLVRMSVEAGMGKSYRELVGWQKAMLLVTEIYRATKTFPIEERDMASRTSSGGPLFQFLATLLRVRRGSLRGTFIDFSVLLEAPWSK